MLISMFWQYFSIKMYAYGWWCMHMSASVCMWYMQMYAYGMVREDRGKQQQTIATLSILYSKGSYLSLLSLISIILIFQKYHHQTFSTLCRIPKFPNTKFYFLQGWKQVLFIYPTCNLLFVYYYIYLCIFKIYK